MKHTIVTRSTISLLLLSLFAISFSSIVHASDFTLQPGYFTLPPGLGGIEPVTASSVPINASPSFMATALQKSSGFAAPYLAQASPYIAALAAWSAGWRLARKLYSERRIVEIGNFLKGIEPDPATALNRERIFAYLHSYATSGNIKATFNSGLLDAVAKKINTHASLVPSCIVEDQERLKDYEQRLRSPFLGTTILNVNIGFSFDNTLEQCFVDSKCAFNFRAPENLAINEEQQVIQCMKEKISEYDAKNIMWNSLFGGVTSYFGSWSIRGKNSFKLWATTLLDIKQAQWHLAAFAQAIQQSAPKEDEEPKESEAAGPIQEQNQIQHITVNLPQPLYPSAPPVSAPSSPRPRSSAASHQPTYAPAWSSRQSSAASTRNNSSSANVTSQQQPVRQNLYPDPR